VPAVAADGPRGAFCGVSAALPPPLSDVEAGQRLLAPN